MAVPKISNVAVFAQVSIAMAGMLAKQLREAELLDRDTIDALLHLVDIAEENLPADATGERRILENARIHIAG